MTRHAAHHHFAATPAEKVQRGPLHGLDVEYAERLARIAAQAGVEWWEVREAYEERAAVRQYLGKMDRGIAESVALDDTEAMFLRRVVP